MQGYTDLTDSLDKVKKTLDQVTHLLTEKVRVEIVVRDKKCKENLEIMAKAEEEIIDILKVAAVKLEDKLPEMIMQSIGGQLVSTKASEINAQRKMKMRESDHLDPSAVKVKDFAFPASNKLNYETFIIGLIHKPGRWNGVNFILSDGTRSTLP